MLTSHVFPTQRHHKSQFEKIAEELGTDGRILIRESGTELVIRVMVEATSDEICEKYVDSVLEVISQS